MKLRNIIFLACLLLAAIGAHAQAPQSFNYQAVARDVNGSHLANQAVGLQISLRQGSASGTVAYTETHAVTTSNIGLLNVAIGGGTVTAGNFATIDWSQGPYFIEVGLDATGGTNYTVLGTQQLLSVPYALYAANSGTPGPQGATGPAGPQGAAGPAGAAGTNGIDGQDGSNGLSFLSGSGAPANNVGVDGDTYIDLVTGDTYLKVAAAWSSTGNSLMGPSGATGAQGPIGLTGATGPQGATGLTGAIGPQGPIGLTGATGPQGPQGNTGLTGATGPQGPQGNTGLTGAIGPQGPAGPTGPTGATGPAGVLASGTTAGNTIYWNGTTWVLNNNNLFNNGGNIGVGTNNPVSKLTVNGRGVFGGNNLSSNDPGDDLYLEKSGGYTQMHLFNLDGINPDISAYISENATGATSLGATGSTAPALNIWTLSNHPIRFSTNNLERLAITESGNVGVGTTAPVSKFTVNGRGVFGGNILTFNDPNDDLYLEKAGNFTQLHMVNLDAGHPLISAVISTNATGNSAYASGATTPGLNIWTGSAHPIRFATNGSERMVIDENGLIGLGLTNPSFQLQLGVNSAAKPVSSAWTVPSDSRLKTNVQDFQDGLNVVSRIHTVTYNYTGEAGMPTNENAIGTLAQELQAVAPYMVKPWTYTDAAGQQSEYLAVDYGAMDMLLTNAVQEQQAQIEALQAEVNALRTQLAAQSADPALLRTLQDLQREVAQLKAQ